MGNFCCCTRCGNRIQHEDFRFRLPTDDYLCYDCAGVFDDMVMDWIEKEKKRVVKKE